MKHTPWKTAVAVVAGTSLLLGLGACGRSEGASTGASAGAVTSIDSEPATGDLTVWAMGNEGDLLGDFVDGFKEENPDVNITVTAIPWASAHDKIQTAIAAGTVPDVIQMGTTWMADFADAFAPVPENFDLSDFSAGPLEAGQVDGEQLGVPWYVDSHVLYYRTDIAAQAGWKFIQWMTEPETQIEWYKTATVLPSSQSAWEDEVLAGDEKLAAYGKQLESTQAPPAVPTWAQVSAAGDRIMEQIYKGQLTVDEGLKNLQAEAESIGTGE